MAGCYAINMHAKKHLVNVCASQKGCYQHQRLCNKPSVFSSNISSINLFLLINYGSHRPFIHSREGIS